MIWITKCLGLEGNSIEERLVDYCFSWKNNGRTKVMIGCGTRPEIIRLAAVIKRCREYYDTCIVYYNQNWDRNLSKVLWKDFELRNEKG